jgi:hypothetical protein
MTSLVNQSVLTILQDISKEYDIDIEELKAKYVPGFEPLLTQKKRGRKKKIKDEYIETEEFDFKGKTYLVDSNGIVYSNDTKNPIMLGYRNPDGSIHFVNEK